MHRLLYSAAPLLAGSLVMGEPLASPLGEICDRSMVRVVAGSDGSASDAPRCPVCRMPTDAVHGTGVPLQAPLWTRSVPANASYPGSQATRGANDLKICVTCHDGSLAGMLTSATPMPYTESLPGNESDKRNAGGLARP